MSLKTILLSGLISAAAVIGITGCSQQTPFIGSWKAISPADITASVPGAERATSELTFTFSDGTDKTGGKVALTNVFVVDRTLQFSDSIGTPVKVSVNGVANVDGTWTFDIDDDDDLLVNYDLSSLKVDVDKNGVQFDRAIPSLSEVQLDSLRVSVAESCKAEMQRVVASELTRYSVIDDVEVSKDRKVLGFEVKSPKQDLRFNNVDL